MARISIEVRKADALSIKADVLALKYAQALYGVDAMVAGRLSQSGQHIKFPKPWKFRIAKGADAVEAAHVLFMGVPALFEFGYGEIREFAHKVLSALAREVPETEHLALTVHGPGYGLDEVEAFEAEIAGLVDAIRSQEMPESLQRITVVEDNLGRARRLQSVLLRILPGEFIEGNIAGKANAKVTRRLAGAGYESNAKPHVFVAMPFKEEMDDPWYLGIQPAVRAAGFICERADLSPFAGDVIEWVRTRIRTSSYLVAVLTDANPNVYLEVGYAWGIGVPTVLLVSESSDLKFDVRGQRCLVYGKKITELKRVLTKELKQLRQTSNPT
jgi:hypothetical protein